jgi:hypothetical protein
MPKTDDKKISVAPIDCGQDPNCPGLIEAWDMHPGPEFGLARGCAHLVWHSKKAAGLL